MIRPHRCWVEINIDAIQSNARQARSHGFELIAIVKANGYGHGAVTVAKAIEPLVDLFGVANIAEAFELREAGLTRPLLLLGTVLPEERRLAAEGGFHVSISTREEARSWSALASSSATTINAHAVIDTGMGRMGFPEVDWTADLIHSLLSLEGLSWKGLCSHFPSADEDRTYTLNQISRFRNCVSLAAENGLHPPMIHLANSAGLLGFAGEMRGWCTHARPGLMLYGVNPLQPEGKELKTTLTWKSLVTLVRTLEAGHGISYGRTFLTKAPTKVATVALGYADGLHRKLSGSDASFTIRGQRCPLLGRITMDQIVLDITALDEDIQPGEEVILLGSPEPGPSVEEIARKAGTIPWEIFTGIGLRVERESIGGSTT
jgi:alanine racemase